MSVRLATFNIENLMRRFDFTGFRNNLYLDRSLALFDIADEEEFRRLEAARVVAHSDDARQLSALAIAATRADIICLQEVDNIEVLKAFEYGYLFKMVGSGYRQKFTTAGNDTRGIDVAVMARDQTVHGQPIEFVRMTSHAHVTYADLDLHTRELAAIGVEAHERLFRRDCLELDLAIGGRPFTLYTLHLKSMGSTRDGIDGRDYTAPVRLAEARGVRRIIEVRFGREHAARRYWAICGDLNDYRERILVNGDEEQGLRFDPVADPSPALDILAAPGFAENMAERLPPLERWTLYHTRGPSQRHLCQLDYILLSERLARHNSRALPKILRKGQPWRTPFPPGQETDRFPRTGWDRPKASDHCPIVIEIDIP